MSSVFGHAELDEFIGFLTPRTAEAFVLMASGLSNDEMAVRMGISKKTVRNHIWLVYEAFRDILRFENPTRLTVIRWAAERGLSLCGVSPQ